MNRYRVLVLTLALAVLSIAAVGCAGTPASEDESGETMVGLVAAQGDALIEVSDQPGAEDRVTIDRVVAPEDSWIVVHLDEDGKPGPRIGLLAIEAGEQLDVTVELDDPIASDALIVAVHGDRGTPGEFEFDMEDFEGSPDKPFFVNGEEVATSFGVR